MTLYVQVPLRHCDCVVQGSPSSQGVPTGAEPTRHCPTESQYCAQSFGARLNRAATGSLADAGAFSFYPTKNLGGVGDGGLLTTDDEAVAEAARMLRNHGERSRYNNEMLGYNSRLDELQAAILRVQLPELERWAKRQGVALHPVPEDSRVIIRTIFPCRSFRLGRQLI